MNKSYCKSLAIRNTLSLMDDSHYCDIEELLLECGLRNTKQKHALIKSITSDRPFTAQQLLDKLGPRWGNQSTLHRALSQLKEVGFLTEAFDSHGENFYERTDRGHHDHLECVSCKSYKCVPCPNPTAEVPKAKIISHQLIFRGLCLKCL